ncbi:hypothetical protein MRB53_005826 [Persea americana]|uniref:Uncharacterized protein n=1 Tax=Persea americana TaxID=3435 RepID=A0ACC2MEP9_PERAE|nr:hypothetical protein MRB53_005826 [Persea americana]
MGVARYILGSQEGVARSRRNSRNREAQTMSHTAGTKSFTQIRDEASLPHFMVLSMLSLGAACASASGQPGRYSSYYSSTYPPQLSQLHIEGRLKLLQGDEYEDVCNVDSNVMLNVPVHV